MKKKTVLNLIKYHAEKNDIAFRDEAYEVARYFDQHNDYQLAEYIMALMSEANTFTPQIDERENLFLKRLDVSSSPLPLSESINESIIGIINAVGHDVGVNKFLFEGPPGTGKTESAKHIAHILERDLFIVDFDTVIDSKLGQTSKNIAALFEEIAYVLNPHKVIVLFDEIDALAIDRINSQDVREMGRATSSVLKGLDGFNEKVVLIATTNLFDAFDRALIRRFDAVVDFSDYSKEDLVDVGEIILKDMLPKFKTAGRNMRLFKKILSSSPSVPYPGELKNLIKTSLAFSDPSNEFDYLRKLYTKLNHCSSAPELRDVQGQGFSTREIEILTGISKSKVSRQLQGV